MAAESHRLTTKQREQVAAAGRKKLDARATGKRAWKSWARAQELNAITLSNAQVAEIIAALGGRVPAEPTRLALVLSQVLTEVCHGAA